MVDAATKEPREVNEKGRSDPASVGARRAALGPTGLWRSPTANSRCASAAPLGMLGLLAIQFLLGMAVNLYVKLSSAGGAMTEMMGNGPVVVIHMMLGRCCVLKTGSAQRVRVPSG